MAQRLCVHQIGEAELASVPGFAIAVRTNTPDDLRNALGTLDFSGLLIDLDAGGAIQCLISALELRPRLPVVGITAKTDAASVLVAQRAGCSQVTLRPIDPADLLAAMQNAIGGEETTVASRETIAIFGTVGGAGTTTLASHLAVELAHVTVSPTALFDLDLEFGGIAHAFDLTPSFTIADLTSAGAIDRSLLERGAIKAPHNVHIFDRPHKLSDAHAIDEFMIRMMLQVAHEAYRFVVLDLPRRFDAITGCAIEQSTRLLLVTQLTVPSIKNTQSIMETLEARGYPSDRIDIAINRYSGSVHNVNIAVAQEQLGRKVLGLVPSDFQAVTHALDVGTPLGKRNPVRHAIHEIAMQLVGHQKTHKPKSWLAKLALSR